MKFDFFEKELRQFETVNDPKIHPHMFVVVRIDGRNFSRLTRRELKVKPFNIDIKTAMIETTKHVMDCGFKSVYGFTQSDEISLLLDSRNEIIQTTFGGKLRKYISILASEATSKFIREMNDDFTIIDDDINVAFDCRVLQLPSFELVLDYFLWRISDSERNCLNAWCYWILTHDEGLSPAKAQGVLNNENVVWRNEFLFKHGMNFNDLPHWQKRGMGLYWENYEKDGFNPITKKNVKVNRRKITLTKLPRDNIEYANMIKKLYESYININS